MPSAAWIPCGWSGRGLMPPASARGSQHRRCSYAHQPPYGVALPGMGTKHLGPRCPVVRVWSCLRGHDARMLQRCRHSGNNGRTCLCSVERTKPALPSWSNDWLRASMVGFRGGGEAAWCVLLLDLGSERRVKQQGARGRVSLATQDPGTIGGLPCVKVYRGLLIANCVVGGWCRTVEREWRRARRTRTAKRSLTDGRSVWLGASGMPAQPQHTHCIARHETGPSGPCLFRSMPTRLARERQRG